MRYPNLIKLMGEANSNSLQYGKIKTNKHTSKHYSCKDDNDFLYDFIATHTPTKIQEYFTIFYTIDKSKKEVKDSLPIGYLPDKELINEKQCFVYSEVLTPHWSKYSNKYSNISYDNLEDMYKLKLGRFNNSMLNEISLKAKHYKLYDTENLIFFDYSTNQHQIAGQSYPEALTTIKKEWGLTQELSDTLLYKHDSYIELVSKLTPYEKSIYFNWVAEDRVISVNFMEEFDIEYYEVINSIVNKLID